MKLNQPLASIRLPDLSHHRETVPPCAHETLLAALALTFVAVRFVDDTKCNKGGGEKKKQIKKPGKQKKTQRPPHSSFSLRVGALLLAHADHHVDEAAVVLDALHGAALWKEKVE